MKYSSFGCQPDVVGWSGPDIPDLVWIQQSNIIQPDPAHCQLPKASHFIRFLAFLSPLTYEFSLFYVDNIFNEVPFPSLCFALLWLFLFAAARSVKLK